MASIRVLKSGRINAQIRRRGKRPLSKTFDTREEAEDWVSQFDNFKHLDPSPDRDKVLNQFIALGRRYCDTVLKSRPSRSITLGRIERIAQHLPDDARDVSIQDVNRYRLMRLEQVAPATCREELQIIHRIYRWANRELILDKNKYPSPCNEIPMPPASRPRKRVVERHELNALLSALSPQMASIVELAFETAMRRGEIVKLRARDVRLDDRIASVIEGKTGDRSVPLTTRAVELLRDALQSCNSPEAVLFPVKAHSVSTAVRRARESIGLDADIRLHQMRHTRITNVARMGFNQAQIMMVSGHRDVRSVQRYTHLNVRDVIRLLD